MILFFLGCGSDSTPGSGKKAKSGKGAESKNAQTMNPLLADKSGPLPQAMPFSEIPAGVGMPTQEQLDAARKGFTEWERRDPNTIQIAPGMTLGQINARLEAERAKKPDPKVEVFPGLTQEKLDAKLREARERAAKPPGEIFPGLTEEQLAAKMWDARNSPPSQVEVFPGAGITLEELKAKVARDRQRQQGEPDLPKK